MVNIFFSCLLYIISLLSMYISLQGAFIDNENAPVLYRMVYLAIGCAFSISIILDILTRVFIYPLWIRKVIIIYYTLVMLLLLIMAYAPIIREIAEIFLWGIDYPLAFFLLHWWIYLLFSIYFIINVESYYKFKWHTFETIFFLLQLTLGISAILFMLCEFIFYYWAISYTLLFLIYVTTLIKIVKWQKITMPTTGERQ